ncbi:hypothetical protein CAPTEDRAFT_212884 [Capitella teleta]|uniref:Fibronectin type-III domain-containing protein n=1 Tax=Capitella teleta TaxID=283909 RepID=R7U6G7_CAPTE|nr:hypothetical protein CAPTEDRAFT_212884 [Capitella teleta]|eukprot:ELT98740.1 hypothetical protein CAPTEDRAFT_212884 [Capitella teleta]
MQEFAIGVGNTSDVTEHTECAYHETPVPPGGHVTLDCPAVGRFVSVARHKGLQTWYMTICEFVVIGRSMARIACKRGSFGVNCIGKCSGCRDDECSAVDDGRCSDGCRLWFTGAFCREERTPTLKGSFPSVNRNNESAMSITWTQDPAIPDNHAQYYGYTVAYAVSYGDMIMGPSIAHDPSTETRSVVVPDVFPCMEYDVQVRPYRKVYGVKQYGWSSETVHVRLPSAHFVS